MNIMYNFPYIQFNVLILQKVNILFYYLLVPRNLILSYNIIKK